MGGKYVLGRGFGVVVGCGKSNLIAGFGYSYPSLFGCGGGIYLG